MANLLTNSLKNEASRFIKKIQHLLEICMHFQTKQRYDLPYTPLIILLDISKVREKDRKE